MATTPTPPPPANPPNLQSAQNCLGTDGGGLRRSDCILANSVIGTEADILYQATYSGQDLTKNNESWQKNFQQSLVSSKTARAAHFRI